MNAQILAVKRILRTWPGVEEVRGGRFGADEFRYGGRELGHLHRDGTADLPVAPEVRQDLLAKGRAQPHRAGEEGYVSYPVLDDEDVAVVLEVMGWNYDRAQRESGPG